MAVRVGFTQQEVSLLSDAIKAQSDALIAGLEPTPLWPISLACTCDRCIDPKCLGLLEKTPPPDLTPDLINQYYGGVAGAGGPHTDEMRHEAHVIMTHTIARLGEWAILPRDEARSFRRHHYYLDADYLVPGLMNTGFVPRLGEARRSQLLTFLANVTRYSAAVGTHAFNEAICFLSLFGGDIRGLVAEFRTGRPLRHLRFWTALAGSHVGSHPDRRTTAMDFHLFLSGMPLLDRDALLTELEKPQTEQVIERFAFAARDPDWLTYLSRLLEWREMTILATRHSEYRTKRF